MSLFYENEKKGDKLVQDDDKITIIPFGLIQSLLVKFGTVKLYYRNLFGFFFLKF